MTIHASLRTSWQLGSRVDVGCGPVNVYRTAIYCFNVGLLSYECQMTAKHANFTSSHRCHSDITYDTTALDESVVQRFTPTQQQQNVDASRLEWLKFQHRSHLTCSCECSRELGLRGNNAVPLIGNRLYICIQQ